MVITWAVGKLEHLIARNFPKRAGTLISYGEMMIQARAKSLADFEHRLEILKGADIEIKSVEVRAVTRESFPFGKIYFSIEYIAIMAGGNTLKAAENYPLVVSDYSLESFQGEIADFNKYVDDQVLGLNARGYETKRIINRSDRFIFGSKFLDNWLSNDDFEI